jgi:hypothetical protein
MRAPPTLAQAKRITGLLVPEKLGIYTFSNASEWDAWAEDNCHACMHYAIEGPAGLHCAFEAAAMLGTVSPSLALLFGWTQNPEWDKPDDHRQGWTAPPQCSYFSPRPIS